MSINTGPQAFDDLVNEKYMVVNEIGWGRIVRGPSIGREQTPKQQAAALAWFVKRIKALGAYSVMIGGRAPIEVNTGAFGDELVFRKNIPEQDTDLNAPTVQRARVTIRRWEPCSLTLGPEGARILIAALEADPALFLATLKADLARYEADNG